MDPVGGLFAGAAVGTLFTLLYDAVKDVKNNIQMFRPLLQDLMRTLDALKPLFKDIERFNELLDRPAEEVQSLEELLESGAELVHKCSKIGGWSCKKYKYAKRLSDLDSSLKRLLDIVSVQGTRDGKETLVEVKAISEQFQQLHVSIAELKERQNVVVQNQIETGGLCEVPEPLPVTVGLDVPLRDLKKKLLQDGESMLVLTAPGGSGKTTLATKFCQDQEVKDTFKDNILFFTVSSKPNLEQIIQQLFQRKRKRSQVPTFEKEENAVKWLNDFLKEEGQNPLLVVLDDVWPGPGAEFLLDKFGQSKMSNHKILVTSRSEFPRFGSPYYLPSLNYEDAMKLFHHTASLGDKSSHIPDDLSREVVQRCKGFPLAITVVGKSLCGKPIEFWQNRIKDWSSILDSEDALLDCLQSSLDALDEKETIIKEGFMDLASFPEDQKIPAAALIDMWAELYELDEDFMSIMNLHDINARSLANLVVTRNEKIEVVDGYYNEHYVTQHDMLRELAIYNSKLGEIEHRTRLIVGTSGDKQPKWLTEQKSQPISARLLSISSDGVFSTKWESVQLPQVEVLVLNFQKKNTELPEFVELPEVVKKIDKLKVLIVTNYDVLSPQLSNFQLLGSLSNLKRIRLERISIRSITKNLVPLRSLKKISFFMCNIGQAFNNCSIKISDAFPTLEEMNIDYCHDLVELPAELFDLFHLKKLSITNCHKLYALPDGIETLINLAVLRLRSCTSLVKLPDSISNLTMLNNLDISNCISIKELPDEIGEMSGLTKLNMRHCSRLRELPVSVFYLEQKLEVMCDEDTEMLWEPFLPSLRNISIKVAKEHISLNWLHKP